VFKVGIFDFLNKKAAQQKPVGKVIRHIVCLCYDAPYINSLKPQMQDFIIKAEQERGSIIAPTSRITFDSFYDNSDLEKPDMIRQKLEQAYCQVYRQNAMYKLADKTVAREVQYRDGHTLVKYFVLYAEDRKSNNGSHALAAPATIKIIRDSSLVAAAAPTIISLNGKQVATIKNGGDAIIRVTTSPIVLETNAYGSKNVRYELDVPSGGYGEVHVKANVFLPKLTVWR
jgi:hypothetical protein